MTPRVTHTRTHLDNGLSVTSVPRRNERWNGKVAESAMNRMLRENLFGGRLHENHHVNKKEKVESQRVEKFL